MGHNFDIPLIKQATMMANGAAEDEEGKSYEERKVKRSWPVDVKKREAAMETVLPVVADSYRDIIKMVTLVIQWSASIVSYIAINLHNFSPLELCIMFSFRAVPIVSPFLAPQSGALRISAYGDFQSQSQSQPNPSTYSFRAFKPFYGDQKQCK